MRNYIILNGNNSNTISGLLIQSLPPISKPLMRTAIEEIDGRDGDIVTNLGYSAYDKEVSIGLYGTYDVDEVIKYFNDNMTGQVTFSNEPDKYYNYEIINQIDFERLIRFKTAIVTLHCQPFKYPTEETPVEINIQNITNEAEEMDLDNTADAPMGIDLKGNTYQDSTTGKNLIPSNYFSNKTINGLSLVVNEDGSIKVSGTATSAVNFDFTDDFNVNLASAFFSNTGASLDGVRTIIAYYNTSNERIVVYGTSTLTNVAYVDLIRIYVTGAGTYNQTLYCQLESGNEATSYEKPTNGPSPNPDYPQEIHNVSGDNTIEICGKNLFDISQHPFIVKRAYDTNGASQNWNGYSGIDTYFEVEPSTTYTFSNNLNQPMYYGLVEYDSSKTIVNVKTSNTTTFTTQATTKYIRFAIHTETIPTEVQIEKSSTATEYEAYTGNSQLISLGVENLWDFANNNFTNQNAFPSVRNSDGSITFTCSNNGYCFAKHTISLNAGTYTLSTSSNNNFTILIDGTEYGKTFTINETKNVDIRCFKSNSTIGDTLTITWIQLEKGSKANSYSPYGTTPIKLCSSSDGTKKDGLIYDLSTDKLYKYCEIGKVVLNGGFVRGTTNVFYTTSITDYATSDNIPYCEYYKGITNVAGSGSFENYNNVIAFIKQSGLTTPRFYVKDTRTDDATVFNNLVATTPLEVYYALATPITIEIDNDKLKQQVKALIQNARSYDDKTHITQNANDKPFILNATAVQKGTDTATVDNDGNIYSKPTLDIEGNGIVAIYLNGNQMFSVDLSNSSECIVDVTNLEAYDPETNELMNRQVTGDYSKFILPVGENQVKVSGNVTKTTISDYVRWL